jgi:hypothetical protein
MKDAVAEARLWVVNKLAEVLTDLADDPDEPGEVDLEELHDQMKNVANLLLESLNFEIKSVEDGVATCLVGEDA